MPGQCSWGSPGTSLGGSKQGVTSKYFPWVSTCVCASGLFRACENGHLMS